VNAWRSGHPKKEPSTPVPAHGTLAEPGNPLRGREERPWNIEEEGLQSHDRDAARRRSVGLDNLTEPSTAHRQLPTQKK